MPRKFGGMNFSVRGIVYPTVVRAEFLNPVCILESPGAFVKFRCLGWIYQNPWGWDPGLCIPS